jgi:hypothetical protein
MKTKTKKISNRNKITTSKFDLRIASDNPYVEVPSSLPNAELRPDSLQLLASISSFQNALKSPFQFRPPSRSRAGIFQEAFNDISSHHDPARRIP